MMIGEMTAQRVGRSLLWTAAAVGTIIAGAFLLDLFSPVITKYIVYVPVGHDERLVGEWHGRRQVFGDGPWKNVVTVFNSDGTGKTLGTTKFDWGTQDGVVYFRYLATDAWAPERIPYAVNDGGRKVEFMKRGWCEIVAPEMLRTTTREGSP
jgi:hypothetical protein